MTNDHRIWKDFKNIQVNVDTALIFPHGAGGHYIAKSWADRHRGKLNEYHISQNKLNYPWFRMDTWGMEYTNSAERLDDLYDVIEAVILPNLKSENQIMLGHYLPYITSKIFNLSINNLIEITISKEWAWLPMTLANAKNLFTSSYNTKHFLIGHILSNYDSQSKLQNSPFSKSPFYNLMTADSIIVANEKTKTLREGLIDESSPYIWDYVVWTRTNKYPINEDTFVDFATVVFGEGAANQYYQDYYGNVRKELWPIRKIDYMELFFTFGDSLPGINIEELRNYSRENIEILRKMTKISSGTLNSLLTNSVQKLENFIQI